MKEIVWHIAHSHYVGIIDSNTLHVRTSWESQLKEIESQYPELTLIETHNQQSTVQGVYEYKEIN